MEDHSLSNEGGNAKYGSAGPHADKTKYNSSTVEGLLKGYLKRFPITALAMFQLNHYSSDVVALCICFYEWFCL
jgi:hypothetical protein